jgi:hypothetical protein
MGPPDEPRMMSNPAYERLETLRSTVRTNRYSMETSLSYANMKMTDGSTWTGSSVAQPWAEEVGGRHGDLPGLMDAVIAAIEERMGAVPEEVPDPAGQGPF